LTTSFCIGTAEGTADGWADGTADVNAEVTELASNAERSPDAAGASATDTEYVEGA